MDLAVECYRATAPFPASEVFGMTSQIRRSAASIAANIAEGHGRENTGSFIQFLRVAQGSVKELETHIILCQRVGLLDDQAATAIMAQGSEIGRMLRSLIRSLQSKA
jgi:four helix bundle protein